MYTFTIYQPNGSSKTYEHIVKVFYVNFFDTEVTGDEILTHHYPTECNIHLYSGETSYTISKDLISVIEVKKEN